MRGGVFPARTSEIQARQLIDAEPLMTGRDLAREVTPAEPVVLEGSGPRIAMIDTGRQALDRRQPPGAWRRGDAAPVHRDRTRAARRRRPTRSSSPTGPVIPARSTTSSRPSASWSASCRCTGSASATSCCAGPSAFETYKLPFGHHGANHPVKDLTTGRTEITSQNHGFAVLGPGGARTIDDDEPVRWETDFGAAELSHINLYDRTVEGLRLLDVPGATVQYHPEAGPGPHDALYLFDRFVDEITAAT